MVLYQDMSLAVRRFFYMVLTLCAVFFLPFWCTVSLLVLGVVFFRSYYESLIVVFLQYILYASSVGSDVIQGRVYVVAVLLCCAFCIYIKDTFIRDNTLSFR